MHFFLKSLIFTQNHTYLMEYRLLLIFNRVIILIGCTRICIFLILHDSCILQLQWRKEKKNNSGILCTFSCQKSNSSDFSNFTSKLRKSRTLSGNQQSKLTLSLTMFSTSSSSCHYWIGSWIEFKLLLLSGNDFSSTAISIYIYQV